MFLSFIMLAGAGTLHAGQSGNVPAQNALWVGQTEEVRPFDIPAGPLVEALNRLADASGMQIVYDAKQTEGLTTQGLEGTYTPKEAFEKVLDGTHLNFRFTESNNVVLESEVDHTLTLEVQSKELKVIQPERFAENEADPEKEKARDDKKEEATRLPPVAVEGAGQIDPKEFVVNETPTATKTETPLIEIPQSVSIITRKRMTDQAVVNLAQALKYAPGVQSATFGVDSRVDWFKLRGFNSTWNSLFKDGLRLSMPAGFLHIQTEPYGLDRVDIFRGPSSVLYGQNTPGGMVNLVSKKPTLEPRRQVALMLGSFDRKQLMVDIGGPVEGTDELHFRLVAMARDSDTQLDFVEDNRFYFAPSVTWRPNENTTFTLLSHYQYDDSGNLANFFPVKGTLFNNPLGEVPTSRFTGEPNYDQYTKTQASVAYQFEHRINNAVAVRQNFRYFYIDYTNKQIYAFGLQADNRTLDRAQFFNRVNADSFAVDNQIEYKVQTGPFKHTLLTGLDFQTHRVDTRAGEVMAPTLDLFNPRYNQSVLNDPAFSTAQDITQFQTGVYIQDQIKWNRLILVLSGRHDWASSETEDLLTGGTTKQSDTAFTGRAGVVYESSFGLAPYASVSESFVPVVGSNFLGQKFEPETATQIEVGLKYEPPGLDARFTVSVFDLRRQKVRTGDPNNPLNVIQTGEIRSRGIELEGIMALAQGLEMVANYSFLDMEVTQSNDGDFGKTPFVTPDHLASVWTHYTVPSGLLKNLGVGAGANYTGTTFADDANTIKVPSYLIFDAAVNYRLNHWEFAVNLRNALDKEYIAGCFSIACFYGDRRNVMGTVRYNW
ncbi:TonB-dependent siderophore receptor [Nitrospina watsonii]|uniref:TonB-dependent siderophore receptor n=1 Tax=Nitrospina watsonii TaxID=1323948 RepID=UPI00248F9028|nr:TonB-dependent siderophore receptor [Nitrospina watsonii]